MLIKLTNAAFDHAGNTIYINTDHISAIYESADIPGGSISTYIYGGFTGVQWKVEESLNQVVKMITEVDTDTK